MKRGVVIACVGVLAVGAVAIGVGLQPAATSSDSPTVPVARHSGNSNMAAAARGARLTRSDKPTTAATAVVPLGPLPAAYRILLTRSIFSPGPVAGTSSRPNSGDGILALRGIMQQGRGFIAFVENTTSREAQQVRIGDTVGRGKIVDIDLHAVKYATGGRAMRVSVGQTFDGGSSSASTSAPAAVATVHSVPE